MLTGASGIRAPSGVIFITCVEHVQNLLAAPSPLRTGELHPRFDLRRKHAEDLQRQSRLYLAADAGDAPRVSLEALVTSFRRIAEAEREEGEIRGKIKQ